MNSLNLCRRCRRPNDRGPGQVLCNACLTEIGAAPPMVLFTHPGKSAYHDNTVWVSINADDGTSTGVWLRPGQSIVVADEVNFIIARDAGYVGEQPPDYYNDLNAIRAVIKRLPLDAQKALRAEVWRLGSQMDVLPHASVYCEAYIRYRGLHETRSDAV